MPGRIAVISAHASPLIAAAGVDACAHNVCVAYTVKALAALGYQIDVFTRRDDPDCRLSSALHPAFANATTTSTRRASR
jgi:D-inositol-3-phosphate glycosyltransferase